MDKSFFKRGLITGVIISILLGLLFYNYFIKVADIDLNSIEIVDLNNQKIDMSIYKDKPLVINFWATWCQPCIEELPYFEIVKKQNEGKINFLFVSDDELSKIIKFQERKKFNLQFVQSKYLNKLGINIRPTTYFFHKNGILESSVSNSINQNELEKKITTLLQE